ncbi:MAG: hypothetical protein ABSA52_18015 [Candidatus Binatia bacterium]
MIDTTTNFLSAMIEGGFNSPTGPALTPDARYLYIGNRGDKDQPGNTVSVIETATNMVAATVTVTPGSGPYSIAITPNGAFAYVTGQYSGTIMVLDTAKALTDPFNAIVTTMEPSGLVLGTAAISPEGKFAYINACATPCNLSSPAFSMAVVDTSTNTIRTTVPGAGGTAWAITPNGEFLYGAVLFNNTVVVTDTAKALSDPSHAISATIQVGSYPYAVALTPDGHFAYVPNCGEYCMTDEASSVSSVSVIDTTTNKVAATIPLSAASGPTGVAITPDGAFAYVPEGWSNSVAVIDTAKAITDPTHAVITNITVCGPRPEGIVIASLPMCIDGRPTCVGDCSVDRQVTVDEILSMVNIALGNANVGACEAGDANRDGQITIDEILTAVNNALNGC